MFVDRATEVSDELYAGIAALIPQLGPNKPIPSRADIDHLVNSESSILLYAREAKEEGGITGILTLAVYRVPTGIRSIVEDVIVDEKYRRQGIAEGLLKKAIELATAAGAGNLSLSANPSRQAAHKLYQKLGFTQRNAVSYILILK